MARPKSMKMEDFNFEETPTSFILTDIKTGVEMFALRATLVTGPEAARGILGLMVAHMNNGVDVGYDMGHERGRSVAQKAMREALGLVSQEEAVLARFDSQQARADALEERVEQLEFMAATVDDAGQGEGGELSAYQQAEKDKVKALMAERAAHGRGTDHSRD